MRTTLIRITHIPTGIRAQSRMRRFLMSRKAAMRHVVAQLHAPVQRPLEMVRAYTADLDDNAFEAAVDARRASILNVSPSVEEEDTP